MTIRYRHRPLRLSKGKHHAVKYLILCFLRDVEAVLGYGAHRTTEEIAYLTGHPAKCISAMWAHWIRLGYIRRDGTWPEWRYGLRQRGRDWLNRADKYLPRAAEIRNELMAYQYAMGISDVPPPILEEASPETAPEPLPEIEPPAPVPPMPPNLRGAARISWEKRHGLRPR